MGWSVGESGNSRNIGHPEIRAESLVGTQDQPREQEAPSSETHAQLGTTKEGASALVSSQMQAPIENTGE